MYIDLYLIRHAQAAGGITDRLGLRYADPDPDLSPAGERQAESAGARLQDCGISRIYASDLLRARRTAEIIDNSVRAGVEIRPELREISMGRYEGKSAEEIEADDPAFFAEWQKYATDLPYPEGECGADVARRCSGLLAEIAGSGLPAAALVSHGGTIRILLCYFLGIGYEKRFRLCAPLENCSISLARYDGERGEYIVQSVNETGHLVEL